MLPRPRARPRARRTPRPQRRRPPGTRRTRRRSPRPRAPGRARPRRVERVSRSPASRHAGAGRHRPALAALMLALAPLALALAPLVAAPARAEGIPIDSETLAGLEPRCLGPGVTSGRISAITGVAGERTTLYVGAAGGGVWKSSDGGITFKAIFDKYCPSIGAIAVDPTRPKIVWVGTGESWVRNSVSVGEGLYPRGDGGDSWEKVGLAQSEHIAAIAVDPRHGDTVFVAALGHLWSPGGERGVYRTRDGGKTWERVLFVDENTGCSDL